MEEERPLTFDEMFKFECELLNIKFEKYKFGIDPRTNKKSLTIYNSVINVVPSQIFCKFNFSTLKLIDCKVNKLDFRSFSNLTDLYVSFGFIGYPNLDISECKIIDYGNIQYVYFNRYTIADLELNAIPTISPINVQGGSSVIHMELHYLDIEDLDFSSFPKLEKVVCSHLKIGSEILSKGIYDISTITDKINISKQNAITDRYSQISKSEN